MPYMRGSGTGDLYIQVNTEVPISLNKEQKELLEKFREIENEKSNPSIKKILPKSKKFLEKLNYGFRRNSSSNSFNCSFIPSSSRFH